jgi:Zn-dependent protease with chaperone function
VNSGLVRVLDDARLAFVIGHEMGHGILGRGGHRSRSAPEAEAQADYLGAYLAARAGYELPEGDMWERLQRDLVTLDDRERGQSHPATYERTIALRETVAEIRAKMAAGTPLTPEPR